MVNPYLWVEEARMHQQELFRQARPQGRGWSYPKQRRLRVIARLGLMLVTVGPWMQGK